MGSQIQFNRVDSLDLRKNRMVGSYPLLKRHSPDPRAQFSRPRIGVKKMVRLEYQLSQRQLQAPRRIELSSNN